MKLISVIGIFLSILGFFGAIRFSSIFFGIFLVGLFLIIYNSILKNEVRSSTQKSPTLIRSISQPVDQLSSFCPKCGAELGEREEFCPFCGNKVR